jgi:hypothetical protein
MNARFLSALAGLGLGLVIVCGRPARSDEPPLADQSQVAAQEGVEVEARGPVHEAFASPTVRGPRATPVVAKRPPEPIEELPPDQKPAGDNVIWIPGYWGWDVDRQDFVWVTGTWRAVPPGRTWVPGHWNEVEGGFQWVSGYWSEQTQETVDFLPQPPDPVTESPPPPQAADDVYVPGTWIYRDTRYLWRPGFWVGYRPGWMWIPAHYVWTPSGYVFVEGYWDYPLSTRGLLFAPIFVRADFYARPGWFYRPVYAVPVPFLMGCLFINLDSYHYCFGDYFEARYRDFGFVSWVDFRIGRRFYDPNFEYYRVAYRDNPVWVRDLNNLYVGRREGRIARPPVNLVQQTTLVNSNKITTINNITVNNITNITNITNVAPLASLNQIRTTNLVKLQPLSRDQIQTQRLAVRDFRAASQERAKIERQVISRGSPLTTGTPTAIRTELPVLKTLPRAATAVKAPPAPAALANPRFQRTRIETSRPGQLPARQIERQTPESGTPPRTGDSGALRRVTPDRGQTPAEMRRTPEQVQPKTQPEIRGREQMPPPKGPPDNAEERRRRPDNVAPQEHRNVPPPEINQRPPMEQRHAPPPAPPETKRAPQPAPPPAEHKAPDNKRPPDKRGKQPEKDKDKDNKPPDK